MVVPGPAEHAAALRNPQLVHGAARREGHVDTGIARHGGAYRGAQAVVAAVDRRQGGVPGEALHVHRVRQEQSRVAVPERGDAELHARAPGFERAETGDLVAHAIIVHVQSARDAGLAQRRVGVGHDELVDVLAELPLETAPLALAEEVGLFEADEPADARALPQGGPEVDVAAVLLGHPEDDVHVPLIVGRTGFRERERLFEEPEVGDVLVRANQRVLAVHVARQDHDRITNHPLAGHFVADDLHFVDDGRLRLVQDPAQVHDARVRPTGPPRDAGAHVHVEVAVVVVQGLEVARRLVPPIFVEVHAGATLLGEWVERLELIRREPPIAHDLERADAIGLALTHLDRQRRLPGAVIDQQCVLEHLEVDVAMLAVELRQAYQQVLAQAVVVVCAG